MSLTGAFRLAPVGVDQMSNVRYIHASAFRVAAADQFSETEIEAFSQHVYSSAYADALSQAVRDKRLIGAWLDTELVGTAAWHPSDDTGTTARLQSLFVRPMFTGNGVGGQLLRAIEDEALRAGFANLTVRAIGNAVPFFRHLGYEISSHGVMAIDPAVSLPVAYMRRPLGPSAASH